MQGVKFAKTFGSRFENGRLFPQNLPYELWQSEIVTEMTRYDRRSEKTGEDRQQQV